MAEISWKDACIKVLKKADEPMHYSEIAGEILSKKYKPGTTTANPAANVYTNIYTSIKSEGEKSPFVQSGKGMFCLNPSLKTAKTKMKEVEKDENLIKAAGIFWKRELVNWKTKARLLGRQVSGSSIVDFSNQKGIYILYDNHSPVYVGMTKDQTLGKRLSDHTKTKLSGRWNRFSWLGVLEVGDDGNLLEPENITCNIESFISAVEAILIETLEPPRNMKAGDGFNAYEYLQAEDTSLDDTIEDIIEKLRGKKGL